MRTFLSVPLTTLGILSILVLGSANDKSSVWDMFYEADPPPTGTIEGFPEMMRPEATFYLVASGVSDQDTLRIPDADCEGVTESLVDDQISTTDSKWCINDPGADGLKEEPGLAVEYITEAWNYEDDGEGDYGSYATTSASFTCSDGRDETDRRHDLKCLGSVSTIKLVPDDVTTALDEPYCHAGKQIGHCFLHTVLNRTYPGFSFEGMKVYEEIGAVVCLDPREPYVSRIQAAADCAWRVRTDNSWQSLEDPSLSNDCHVDSGDMAEILELNPNGVVLMQAFKIDSWGWPGKNPDHRIGRKKDGGLINFSGYHTIYFERVSTDYTRVTKDGLAPAVRTRTCAMDLRDERMEDRTMYATKFVRIVFVVLAVLGIGSLCCAHAPVTLETLTTLRAQERSDAHSVVAGMDDNGELYAYEDGNADQGSVTRALEKAYGIEICGEYDVSGANVRFPYVIERNQRLVDALDALREKSDGFAQWRLLHGRIIITFREPSEEAPVFIMDRTLSVDIEAQTWRALMMQIETAYNARYRDVPLLVNTVCLDMDEVTPLTAGNGTSSFRYQAEASLREVILGIFDKVGNPSLDYGLGGGTSAWTQRRDYHLTIGRPDCRKDYETAEELTASRKAGEERRQRLDTYYERIDAANEAAKAQETQAARTGDRSLVARARWTSARWRLGLA